MRESSAAAGWRQGAAGAPSRPTKACSLRRSEDQEVLTGGPMRRSSGPTSMKARRCSRPYRCGPGGGPAPGGRRARRAHGRNGSPRETLGSLRVVPRPPVRPARFLALVDGDLLVGGEGELLAALDPAGASSVLAGHSRRVVAVGSAGDGEVWSVGQDRTAQSWRRRDVRPCLPFADVGGVRLSAGRGAWLDGRPRWNTSERNLRTGQELQSLSYGGSAIQALRRLPDGGLVFGTTDGRLLAVRPDGGVRWTRDPAHNGPVVPVCLSMDPCSVGGRTACCVPGMRAVVLRCGPADGMRTASDVCPSGKTGGSRPVATTGRCLSGNPSGARRTCCTLMTRRSSVLPGAGSARCLAPSTVHAPHGTPWTCPSARCPRERRGRGARPRTDRVASVGQDGWVRLWTIRTSACWMPWSGVPLDGLGGTHDALLVGDRRGGVHFLDVGG